MTTAPLTWPTVLAVHEWLTAQGWKISQSGLYKHVKEGKLRPGEDGAYAEKAVRRYARNSLKRLDGSAAATEAAVAERAAAQARLIAAQAEKAELAVEKMRGDLVEADAFREALTSRAYVIKSDLLNLAQTAAPEIIPLVQGNPDLAADLTDWLKNRFLDFLDRYARAEISQAEVTEE